MLRSLLIAFLCCLTIEVSGEPEQELFEIAIDASVVKNLVELAPQPIQENVNVKEDEVLMRGCAKGESKINVSPYPEIRGVGMAVDVTSFVNTFTHNLHQHQRQPKHERHGPLAARRDKKDKSIDIEFDWSVHTDSRSLKHFFLSEDGFQLFDARTQSTSHLFLDEKSIQAHAKGILGGVGKEILATLVAPKKIWDRKDKIEKQFSESINTSINQTLDKQLWDSLLPVHFEYLKYVYTPFVKNGVLKGNLFYSSTCETISARAVRAGAPDFAPTLDGISQEHPARFHLNKEALENVAEYAFGGAFLSDGDIAQTLGNIDVDENDLGLLLGDEKEVLLTLANVRPMTFELSEDTFFLSLHWDSLETLGQKFGSGSMTRKFSISRSNGNGNLKLRSHRPVVIALDKGKFPVKVAAHLKTRLDFNPNDGKYDLSKFKVGGDRFPMQIHSISMTGPFFDIVFERVK